MGHYTTLLEYNTPSTDKYHTATRLLYWNTPSTRRYLAAAADAAEAEAGATLRHDIECAMVVGLCQPLRRTQTAEPRRERANVVEAARRFFGLTQVSYSKV